MRPKSLVISAFGPYAGRQEIDFDALDTTGVILICGETGAGKTTLFDAITYVLFGEVSGENRGKSYLRSDFAPADTPTFVELAFTHMGLEYQIRRSPAYMRQAKRGGGLTEEKPTALLHMPHRTLDKIAQVNEAVEELLGMTYGQFKQIVMIAQGEFLQLLLASHEERSAILRRVFATQRYADIQQSLRTQSNALEGELRQLDAGILQAYQAVPCPPGERGTFEGLTDGVYRLPEVQAFWARLAQEAEVRREQLERSRVDLTGQKDALGSTLHQARQWNALWTDTTAREEQLAKAKPLLEQARQEAGRLEAQAGERDQLKLAISKGQESLSKYQQLSQQEGSLRRLEAEKEKAEAQVAAQEASLAQRKQRLAQAEEELAGLQGAEAHHADTQNRLQNAHTQEALLEGLKKDYLALVKARDALAAQQQRFQALNIEYDAQREAYHGQQGLFYSQQAGLLAASLKEGKPCPVCGATTHPAPCPLPPDAPTQAELEATQQALEAVQQSWQAASRQAASLKTDHEGKEARLIAALEKQQPGQAITGDSLRQVLAELRTAHRETMEALQQEAQLAEARHLRQQALGKEQKQLREEMDGLSAFLEEARALQAGLNTQAAQERAQLAALKEGLAFTSEAAALAQLNLHQQELAQRQDALAKAQAQARALEKEASDLEAVLASNQNQRLALQQAMDPSPEENTPLNLGPMEQALEDFTARLEALEQAARQEAITLNALQKGQVDLAARAKAREKAEAQLSALKALADTANGELKGRPKITFETYVQQVYFDQVLHAANQRLTHMTDGRYRLLRRQDALDNRSKFGLELDIADAWTGKNRGVQSMSGGEGFMASLSLALGLSDVVQQMSGGVALDTMFIDEGFGTLGGEALDKAMEIISGLADGHRLVGVISHVEELKAQVERKILIEKGRAGSVIRVEM